MPPAGFIAGPDMEGPDMLGPLLAGLMSAGTRKLEADGGR